MRLAPVHLPGACDLRLSFREIVDFRGPGGVWLFPFDGVHFEPLDWALSTGLYREMTGRGRSGQSAEWGGDRVVW